MIDIAEASLADDPKAVLSKHPFVIFYSSEVDGKLWCPVSKRAVAALPISDRRSGLCGCRPLDPGGVFGSRKSKCIACLRWRASRVSTRSAVK